MSVCLSLCVHECVRVSLSLECMSACVCVCVCVCVTPPALSDVIYVSCCERCRLIACGTHIMVRVKLIITTRFDHIYQQSQTNQVTKVLKSPP